MEIVTAWAVAGTCSLAGRAEGRAPCAPGASDGCAGDFPEVSGAPVDSIGVLRGDGAAGPAGAVGGGVGVAHAESAWATAAPRARGARASGRSLMPLGRWTGRSRFRLSRPLFMSLGLQDRCHGSGCR